MRFSSMATAALSVLASLALIGVGEVRGDEALSAKVDALLAKYNRSDSPGCAVGIVSKGELIYSKGFGSANLDHEVLNTPRTVFEIGSLAKSFTCACMAVLLDRGKVSPNDDIRRHVPEMHEFDPPIRIRHLIRCRSGIWAQWHITQLAGWPAEPIESPYSEDALLTLLAGQKSLPFEPGSQFRYGTGDYFLLGIIVKRVTGQSLADFARENLFKPLGMSSTFIMDDPARIVRHRAVGYYRHPNGHWMQWMQASNAPGGRGLYTSVEDLCRWNANFEDNRLPSGTYMKEFLSKGTILGNRNVLDAQPTGSYRGLKRIQFTGGMPGYVAAVTRFPEQHFTVVCLCNNSTITPWEINSRIADLYLADNLGPEPPSKDKDAAKRAHDNVAKLDESEIRDKVGAFRLRADGRIWKVVLQDGKLFVSDHLNNIHPLIPLGRCRFQPKGGVYHESARFEFTRASPKSPYLMTSYWVGGTLKTDRVEPVEPTQQQLNEYAGEYRSDELTASYCLKVSDGKLYLRVNNRGWEPLDPTVKDEFVAGIRQNHDNRILRFIRDEKDQITGLSVALWRVKGVAFTKVR